MGLPLGILTAGIQLGVEAISVKPKRAIGPLVPQITVREVHTDELEITDHPVEMGASISDHAFKKPAEVVIECMWSNAPQNPGLVRGLIGAVTGTIGGIASIFSGAEPGQMKSVYTSLLDLQQKVERFDVYTGKRVYKDMLIKSLVVTTDKTSENILSVVAHLRQIIIVQTQVLSKQAAPKVSMAIPTTSLPLLDKGIKSLTDGLPSLNVGAAATSLVSSAVGNIASQAQGALSSATGGLSSLFGSVNGVVGDLQNASSTIRKFI